MIFLMLLLSGILTALGTMIPYLCPLVFISQIPLVCRLIRLSEEKKRFRRVFGEVFLFGVGYYFVSWYWWICTYPLSHLGIGKFEAILLIGVCWIGMTLLQTVTTALVFLLFRLLYRKRAWAPLLFASLYSVLQYLMTLTFAGVPFHRLELSVCEFLPFIQSASLFGGWFVGTLIVLINALLSLAVLSFRENKDDRRPIVRYIALALAVLVLNTGFGFLRIAFDGRKDKEENAFTASLIQAGLTTSEKYFWTDAESYYAYEAVVRDALDGLSETPDFVLLPETVITSYLKDNPSLLLAFKRLAKKYDSIFFVGTMQFDPEEAGDRNVITAILPDGTVEDRCYAKQKLVPFGEYTPLAGVIGKVVPIIEEISVADLAPGTGSEIVDFGKASPGRMICFDSIYPSIARESVREGADVLMIFTNDSWYGDSTEVTQHTRHAVLRAVENGRWTLREANSGISALITPTGKVVDEIDVNVCSYLNVKAYTRTEKTLYTVIGDALLIPIVGYLVYSGVLKIVDKRKKA